MWSGAYAMIARMEVADDRGAARDLLRARAAWPEDGFTFQDFALFQGEMFQARYHCDAERSWQIVERYWPRFRASPLTRVAYVADWVCLHRGEVAALYAMSQPPERRAALLEIAARMAARKTRVPRFTLPLRAAVAARSGQLETTVALLREGSRTLPALCAYAARRRLGCLLGGEEGSHRVREADQFFSARGVAQPAQLAAALFPGCEL